MTSGRTPISISLFICFYIMLAASADEGIVQTKEAAHPDRLAFRVPLDFGKKAIWWSPSSNEPCPIQVDEAIRRVMKHFEDSDQPHITQLALLNYNTTVYNEAGHRAYNQKYRGYLFWLVRTHDKRVLSLEWPVRNYRDFLVFFNGEIFEVLPDGNTQKLPPIDEAN